MNYAVVKDALSRCERAERYVKTVNDMARRADVELANGPGGTYRILKYLFNVCTYDHPDFEQYFLPADILAKALTEAAERVKSSVDKTLTEARALVQEGFDVDNIGKKSKKIKDE